MNTRKLKNIWKDKYKQVPQQLEKIKQIQTAATGFNANIDAVLKINGEMLKNLIIKNNISLAEIENISLKGFRKPQDVILGIIKCFSRGIAEEWVTEDINVYNWMKDNLGYNRLQMGGQGGIIANVLALLGIKKVVAHTNSHPALQAKQFLDLNNLYAVDDAGDLKKASNVSRLNDQPLIHWIIEFDKGDSFKIENQEFTCPKSNRFIATYDPLNMNLVINKHFISYLNQNKIQYLLISGFHPLLSENNGVKLIKNAAGMIKKWHQNNPEMIMHLEIASTQDKIIRKAILEHILPLMQSAGLNERETIDLLEVMGKTDLAQKIEQETTAVHLFEAIRFLKEKFELPRLQLHMFGLYLTIQDETFPYSAEQNIKGMMTAAVVSSGKALLGKLEKYDNLTQTLDKEVSDIGLKELISLANMLNSPELAETGICKKDNLHISAVPTILIEHPKSLVGMGDTISSVSLVAGR